MLDSIIDRLDVNQYGGLRGLSTIHALIYVVHTRLLAAEDYLLSSLSMVAFRYPSPPPVFLVQFSFPSSGLSCWMCTLLSGMSHSRCKGLTTRPSCAISLSAFWMVLGTIVLQ